MNKFFSPLFKILSILTVLVMVFAQVGNVAAQSEEPTQTSCHALAEKYGNVAQPKDPAWQACFLAGWVNWVFSTDRPLPDDAPEWLNDALQKGGYVQFTEPWKPGCDNTLVHVFCSIGYLKLFGDWSSMMAFKEMGSFMQAGIEKTGPWSDGSLWFTNSFVMIPEGKSLTASQKKLFCEQNVAIAFANDGEFPLPTQDPGCTKGTKFYLREKWNGTCIGDELPNAACNVGEVKVFDDWKSLHAGLAGWNRGSVFANSDKLQEMAPINVDPDKVEIYSPLRTWFSSNWGWLVVILILLVLFGVVARRR